MKVQVSREAIGSDTPGDGTEEGGLWTERVLILVLVARSVWSQPGLGVRKSTMYVTWFCINNNCFFIYPLASILRMFVFYLTSNVSGKSNLNKNAEGRIWICFFSIQTIQRFHKCVNRRMRCRRCFLNFNEAFFFYIDGH